jgi:hypothetical protein
VSEFSIHESRLKTVAINHATAADHVLEAIGPSRLFLVTALFLQSEGTVDVTFKSGATAITGPIAMAVAAPAISTLFWANAGDGIMRGRLSGEDFVMTLSAATQVNGWATLLQIEERK